MPQAEHEFLVTGSQDDVNRQAYASDLRMYVLQELGGSMADVYEHRVKPAFSAANGREPSNSREVLKAMLADPYGQTWSSMIRNCQEMIWDSIGTPLRDAQPDLNQRVNECPAEFGTLTLDPDVQVPRYISASEIHCMPGNYHGESVADDTSQGALFDRGLYLYQGGFAGPRCDSNGRTQAELIKRRWPEFRPKKILDLGCTIGNNTLPYADVFPEAELHAIDVAAPCLRYGHARAEALGKPVHFHQMNAEQLRFADESFDLIVSCILFHETSRSAVPNIFSECYRTLRPGGLMLHMEIPRAADLTPYETFRLTWDTHYNNEPFLTGWMNTDVREVCRRVGFAGDNYVHIAVPDIDSVSAEVFDQAARANGEPASSAGHWGEAVLWHTYGAWK